MKGHPSLVYMGFEQLMEHQAVRLQRGKVRLAAHFCCQARAPPSHAGDGKAGDPGGPDSETKRARPHPMGLEVQVSKGSNGLGPQVVENSESPAPAAVQLRMHAADR